MSEEKTADAVKIEELTNKINELQTALDSATATSGNSAELQKRIKELEGIKNTAFKERDELKSKLKEKEDADAIAKGEFKTLAEQRQAEIEKLTKEKSDFEEKAKAYEKQIKEKRKQVKEQLGDEYKDYMDKLELTELEDLVSKIKKTQTDTDKFKPGGAGGNGNLTVEERVAKMYK
jgi:colicin import membrane protein